MQIVLQWDSSVTALPTAQRTEFEAAITDAAAFFDRTLANNLTVTINVGYGEITDGGGAQPLTPGESEGGPGQGSYYTYSDIRAALLAHANSVVDAAAYAWLPASDPYRNADPTNYFAPVLQMEALGLDLTPYAASDATGSVGFGATLRGNLYDYDPLNRAIAGEGDLIGIAEHEISHALGRLSNANDSGPRGAASTTTGENVMDLFRFSAQGQLDLKATDATYFSLDGGRTPANAFDDTNSDPGDWLGSETSGLASDSFNAFYQDGQEGFVTATDVNLMNVLGYQITDMLPQDAVSGDDVSDILIENTGGAVVYGEIIDQQLQYTSVGGLGPEWSFRGVGNYLGNGQDGFLIENSSGAIVLGNAVTGAYTAVSGLGPEWTFEESGPFFGDSQDQFLVENSAGAVVVGEIAGASTTYTQIGALGSEWAFVGAGDFRGDGRYQFLIENTSGALVIAEAGAGDQAAYTLIGGLGPEWLFVGDGDFLGDGKDQFLIENTSGAVVVGEVIGSAVAFTQVGALGSEWKFVGAGDYAQTGQDSFLIENAAGAIVTGTVIAGQAQYTVVGGLGSDWRFRS
ncbi:MAG TPA: NF038122 family metalloprotease [Caulobacteraceae bacterium]|jgi:hypothetical protein|nr:NF038122 family metalloprotease [Caulobacteraceae bacterium]